jgi:hypothetical protein
MHKSKRMGEGDGGGMENHLKELTKEEKLKRSSRVKFITLANFTTLLLAIINESY